MQTQRKLTFTYTWLIVIFLVVFSVIVSAFFLAMIYQEQRQTILSTLYATDKGRVTIPELSSSDDEGLYYYYILDNRGNVIADQEAFPQDSKMNMEKMNHWQPRRADFRLEWQSSTYRTHDGMKRMGRDRLLLVGARPTIMDNGKAVTIYAAKDVTFYVEVFRNLLLVFLIILVIFVLASRWLSNSMSRKAMIPIQGAFRQQQQFLADASHELRTPLTIMNTSLDVIEMENGEELTPYTREVMTDMKEEVSRMSRMVQNLLLLARSDSGSVEFDMTNFDLVPRIRQWMIAFEALAQQKQITMTSQLPEQMIVVGDAERIKQVVYILLDNALKYTPEQGTVEIVLDDNAKYWRISLRDSGIGIAKEELRSIFDRFYRVEKHRSREEGSAGLGLSIAKWIVEVHQGTIAVDSALGAGSNFQVILPKMKS